MKTRRNAIVTGGTRGIGRGISLALARAGVRVLAPYARNRRAADELAEIADHESLEILPLRGDLTRDEPFQKTVERLREEADTVDIVVHSAASGVHRPVGDITPKHLRWTFEINVFAIHSLLVALLDRIPEGGRIVGVTSAGGRRALESYGAVGASKGALESLFRHYARDLAPRGIAVNLVSPGLVLTDAVEAFPDKERRFEETLSQTPTGRLTTVDEVGQLVAYLCLEAPSQLVGQTISLDGGKTLLG